MSAPKMYTGHVNRRLLPLLAVACSVAGCSTRLETYESYSSAVTPAAPKAQRGDPYAAGGIAEASGGIKTKTQYPTDRPGQRGLTGVVPEIQFGDAPVPNRTEGGEAPAGDHIPR